MAQAKKLPSGAYRVQATRIINGKRIVKSFTVHPRDTMNDWRMAKKQAELLAQEWQLSTDKELSSAATVLKALNNYIDSRRKVLSPRTINDYEHMIKFYGPLLDLYASDISSADIQGLINEWSVSISSKTITNRVNFLTAALDLAGVEKRFKLRFPKKVSKEVQAPEIDDLKLLLQNCSERFKPIILLAAFGSLRRGEIAALKQKDILRDLSSVYVHADMVQSSEGIVYKNMPKTAGSVRVIQLPKNIIELLPCSDDPEAFVFNYTINMITSEFTRLRNKCGLKCSFHTLRHFAASFRSDLGIPSKYIEEVGGWKNESSVLKRVYDNKLNSSRKKYGQMAADYFEEQFRDVL